MPVTVIVARDLLILETEVLSHVPPGVSCRKHTGTDLDSRALFDQLGTGDLFAEHQCFHYSGITQLKLKKHEAEQLEKLLSKLPDAITLICSDIISEEFRSKEDRKLKSAEVKRFSAHGRLIDLRSVSEGSAAIDWLMKWSRETHGIVLKRDQMERLFQACGESVALAGRELAKLELLKPTDAAVPISDNVLDAVLSASPHARFYDIVDKVLFGAPDTLESLREWFVTAPETFRLVNELGRRLLGLKQLNEGKPVQPAFFERQLRTLGSRFSGGKLDRAIMLCAELEHGLKSGTYPAESRDKGELMALELFFRGLHQQPRA